MRRLLAVLIVTIQALIGNVFAEESLEIQRLKELRQTFKTDLPIREERDADGQLSHIGVAIFSDTMQQALNPYLWRGVERIVLRIVLHGSEQRRYKWIQENGVRVFLEACPYGTVPFKTFAKAYPILKNVKGVQVFEDNNRYRIFISGSQPETTLLLYIPKDRELIYGTDKKEEDERQSKRLQNFTGKASVNPLPYYNQLFATQNHNVWHTIGEVFYIDSLCADGYYKILEDSSIVALWTPEHPKESVKNLLLGNILPKGLTIEVTHCQYGRHYETWTCSWPTLLAGLKDEGMMDHFAAAQYMPEKGMLTGILILRNTSFEFIHMLLLSIPIDQLGTEKPTTLSALLYTNTPQHNVYSLFEEYLPNGKDNSKNRNKIINEIPYLRK